MEVKITVEQDIVNGVISEKKYSFWVKIHYGTGDIKWVKDFGVHDLDADTIKELIPKLNQELEKERSKTIKLFVQPTFFADGIEAFGVKILQECKFCGLYNSVIF